MGVFAVKRSLMDIIAGKQFAAHIMELGKILSWDNCRPIGHPHIPPFFKICISAAKCYTSLHAVTQ